MSSLSEMKMLLLLSQLVAVVVFQTSDVVAVVTDATAVCADDM